MTWSVPVTASTWNPPKSGGSLSPHVPSLFTLVSPVTPRCDTNLLHCSDLHQTLWLLLAKGASDGFSDPSQPLSRPGLWLSLSLLVPRPPQVTPGPSSTGPCLHPLLPGLPCHTPHHMAPQKHQKHHGTSKTSNPGCSPWHRLLEQPWSSGTSEKLNSKRENLPYPCQLTPPPCPRDLSPHSTPSSRCWGSAWDPPSPQGDGIVLESTSSCFYLQE